MEIMQTCETSSLEKMTEEDSQSLLNYFKEANIKYFDISNSNFSKIIFKH